MSMRARRLAAATTVLAATIAAIVVTTPAHAADGPACGDVITTDTVLTADLVCDGSTDGLVIGADGITLDLGGHSISGPGAYATPHAAVRVARHTDVAVLRGIVSGFQSGVVLDEAWAVLVNKLTVTSNDQGVNLAGGGDHLVSQNTVSGNGRDGVRLGLSAGNTVTQNTVDANTWGIMISNWSSDNTVSRNIVTNSRSNGIVAFAGASGTMLLQNTVTGSWSDGIAVQEDTSGTTVSQNKSIANGGDGLEVWNATIVKNTATGNTGRGIVANASSDGGGNKAAGNLTAPDCIGVVCTAP